MCSILSLSAEEVGSRIAAIGVPYEKYKSVFIDHDINGALLTSITADELMESLQDMGINNKLHVRRIAQEMGEFHDTKSPSFPIHIRPSSSP